MVRYAPLYCRDSLNRKEDVSTNGTLLVRMWFECNSSSGANRQGWSRISTRARGGSRKSSDRKRYASVQTGPPMVAGSANALLARDRTRQVVVRRFRARLIVIEPIVSQALRMDRSHETQLQLIRSRGLPEQSVQLGADVMNDPATASNDSQPAIFWRKSEI